MNNWWVLILFVSSVTWADFVNANYVFKAGDKSLQEWLLPSAMEQPKNNQLTPARIELGRILFFDPRLGKSENMSCASCHSPMLGWSDGLPVAKGYQSQSLKRSTPSLYNVGFNTIQMWDGSQVTLEAQALLPMESDMEMNVDFEQFFRMVAKMPEYAKAFAKAYQKKPDRQVVAMALASFERSIISNNSAFDDWVKGDQNSLSEDQIAGFKIFVDPQKGNCMKCHQPPNFTDNGFHNIGLADSFDAAGVLDLGRYKQKKLPMLKGAFKTPSLRGVRLTAPYFHDGSAQGLKQVIRHYMRPANERNLSPSWKKIQLSTKEQNQLIEFLYSLTHKYEPMELPQLPQLVEIEE